MRALCGQICIVLLLFSFLYLACSLPSALVDTRKCKKSSGDFSKSGSFCRSFYRCKNWIPVEMTCPLDQHFFPAKGYCVWPEEFPCLDRPSTEQCPEPNGKFLKPDTNCKVYYDCCNGRPSEKRCHGDTLFDRNSKKCDWPELVACPDDDSTTEKIFPSTLASSTSTEPSTPSSSTEDRITRHPTSHPTSSKTLTPDSDEDSSEEVKTSEKSKEYTTKHKIKSTYPTISTVSSTIFEKITTPSIFTEDLREKPTSTKEKPTDSPATSHESSTTATSTEIKSRITTVVSTVSEMSTRTTSSIDVTTHPVVLTDKTSAKTTVNYKDKDSTTTTSSPTDAVTYHIFCPQPDGYFPHPSNKHQFIACVGGNLTIMDCPSKLVYDHKKRSCQYKKRKF